MSAKIRITKHAATFTKADQVSTEPPLRRGLILFLGNYEKEVTIFRAMLTLELISASKRLPIPVPQFDSITSVHTGSTRQLKQLKDLDEQFEISNNADENYTREEIISCTPLDCTSPAIVSSLTEKFKSKGCIILQQPSGTPLSMEGLIQLRDKAKQKNVRLCLLAPGLPKEAVFNGIASELMVVTPCEPNPEFDEAFVISCPELANLSILSKGKVLCNVRFGNKGLETQFNGFVAEDLKTRLMAILKTEGWSLEKIGKTLDLNKSNVSRRLRYIDSKVPKGWGPEMLDQWLEACDLPPLRQKVEELEDADDF